MRTRPGRSDPDLVATRQSPVRWLHLTELWHSGRDAATATKFGKYSDKREDMGALPASIYHLPEAEGVRPDRFVVDYLADTGDGFNATYAMARCLTGEFLPTHKGVAAESGRADLLMLGGDEVYPVATVDTYDHRLKNVFDEADDTQGKYVAAIPGNHDWYGGSLSAFETNFCQSYIAKPEIGDGPRVVPEPTGDVILGRYPFQARSYFAAKLPFNWWLWGIDIQLDAVLDRFQLDYFYFAKSKLGSADRVILCTARPSWIDLPEPKRGYETNRTRLTWFANRMFGDDDLDFPRRQQFDRMDHVPIVLSGDKHHYSRYTRVDDGRGTAPQHLVTCGGGGAYLSSTHHLRNDITVPWHLEDEREQPGQSYALHNPFPDQQTSRWSLSSKFLRIPFTNWFLTPLLVAALTVLMAIALTALLRDDTDKARWGAVAAFGVPAALTLFLAWAFRPRPFSLLRKSLTVPPLGVLHVAGYAGSAVLGLWVAAVVAYRSPDLPDWDQAAEYLWTEKPWDALVAGGVVLVVAAMLVFALYFLISDLVGWHENEFFAGMRLDGYKSFIRIVITPPAIDGAAGVLTVVAYGAKDIPDNKDKTSNLDDPEPEVIDTWEVVPTPPQPVT